MMTASGEHLHQTSRSNIGKETKFIKGTKLELMAANDLNIISLKLHDFYDFKMLIFQDFLKNISIFVEQVL